MTISKNEYLSNYRKVHRKSVNANVRRYLQNFRLKVIKKLGNKCKRCGFSDIRALQIDHVNGGGRKESSAKNYNVYGHLKRVIEDKIGKYQLLCANCNWIKKSENKENRKIKYDKIDFNA